MMKKTQLQHSFDPTRNSNPKTRRIRSPAFARIRLRRNAAVSGRKSGGPTTPLLTWKLEDDMGLDVCSVSEPESDKGSVRRRRRRGKERDGVVSARKIAAGIWHVNAGLGFEPNVPDHHLSSLNANSKSHNRPNLMNYPKNCFMHKLGSSIAVPDTSMERATKWDPAVYSHGKLEVSSLRTELEHARARITELETERYASKKKFDHLLRKFDEEKESWRRREHDKIRAVIDSIKEDLNRERKNRKRMEIVNSKLVNELAEVKLSAKRFLQDYEKERKTRELMEEVCDELAKEIGEDKAEFEGIKEESIRIREEVEEEKKMLQMAEVWREERVQMKLVDAKVTLEEKYSQLSKLQSEIEAFLKCRNNSDLNEEEKREAALLREAADSLMAQEVKEFSYQPPPASEDIFSVFEELQPREDSNEREIKACLDNKEMTNSSVDDDDDDDDSGWETVSHIEDQGSSNSVIEICQESNASVSSLDWDENGEDGKLKSDISEVCSVTTKLSRKKGSSITRFWRSSYQNNSENGHRNSFEITNGRMSNATLSPNAKSLDLGLSSPSVAERSSPDSVNPHIINRGMKGCIEWPRGMQKHSLKAKLLEARIESQKIQLRQALKQKI